MVAADVNQHADVVESPKDSSTSETSQNLFSEVGNDWSRKEKDLTTSGESSTAKGNDSVALSGSPDSAAASKQEGGDGTLSAGQAADAAKKDLLDLSERDPLDSGLRHVSGSAGKLAETAERRAKNTPEQGAHSGAGYGPATIEASRAAGEPSYSRATIDKKLGAAGKEHPNSPGADRAGTRQESHHNGQNPNFFNKDNNSHLPAHHDGAAAKINKRISGTPERTGKPESHPGKKVDANDKVNHARDAKDAHKPAKHEAIKKPAAARTRDASPIEETGGELSFPNIDGYDKAVARDNGKTAVAGDSKAVTTGDNKAGEQASQAEQLEAAPTTRGISTRGINNEAEAPAKVETPNNVEAAPVKGESDAVVAATDNGAQAGDRSSESQLESATANGDGQAQLDAALQRMRDGGLLKDASGDGNLTNEELRAGKFETNADKFTDATSKKEFANQVKSVLGREDISAADKASILDSGQNIVEMKNIGEDGMKSQADRELLTTTMFENLGKNWNSISQGDNSSCALTEVNTAQSFLNPAQVAKDTQNVVQDGVWNTKSGKEINVHSSWMKPDAEASKGLDKDASGRDLGNRNFHTQLMNGKDGSWLNQQQGMLYTNGSAKDGYTEALWKPQGTDKNGNTTYELAHSGSPNTDSSEVADMAKHEDYGMANNVTIAVDKSGWAGAGSKNLTDNANLNQTVKDIEAGKGGDKHYLIMLGAGGDKLLQNGRDVDAGAHSGHAYGAAFSKTANINDRVAGEKQGGEWKAKNTWSDDLTASMDKSLVGADGKMNVAAAHRSMDMSVDREGTPTGGTGSYRDWVDTHPGGNGLDPKDPDALKKDEKKKPDDKDENDLDKNGQNDKGRKAEINRAEGVRAMSEVHNLRAQQEIARQNAASAKGGDALAYMSAAAALEGRVSDLLPMLQIA